MPKTLFDKDEYRVRDDSNHVQLTSDPSTLDVIVVGDSTPLVPAACYVTNLFLAYMENDRAVETHQDMIEHPLSYRGRICVYASFQTSP